MIAKQDIEQRRALCHQRWQRTRLLELLPPNLRATIESARFIGSPEDADITPFTNITAQGIGTKSPFEPHDYFFRELSWEDQVFAILDSYPTLHDREPGWFIPHGVRPTLGSSMKDLIDNNPPCFAVNFGWARSNLRELFAATAHGLTFLSQTFSAGIVIQVVVGYLESDPNPEERIYEVAMWK